MSDLQQPKSYCVYLSTEIDFHEKQDFVKIENLESISSDPARVSELIYRFVYQSVTQERRITPEECRLIIRTMLNVFDHFPNIVSSFWIPRVFMDLYDEDHSIMTMPETQECIIRLMNQMNGDVLPKLFSSHPDNRAELTALIHAVEMLLSLVGTMICYGIDDPDIWSTQWPVELFRPADFQSLDFLFESDQFCTGIVNVLIFCTSVFERSHPETDLFHWDLALLSLVIKNRVLACPGLQIKFHPRIINQLWKCCSSFERYPDSSLPWKEHVFELVSVLCTGKFAGLVGIAGFASDRDQRFHLILKRILRAYCDLESVRAVCEDCRKMKLISPWVQESALQLVLSPPCLRPIPSEPLKIDPQPPVAQVVPQVVVERPNEKRMSPEDEEAFWKEMLEEEEKERREKDEKKKTEKARKSSAKKKKGGKKEKTVQDEAGSKEVTVGGGEEEEVDDDVDVTRLALRKSNFTSSVPSPKPIIPIHISKENQSSPKSGFTKESRTKNVKVVAKEATKKVPSKVQSKVPIKIPNEISVEVPSAIPNEVSVEVSAEVPSEVSVEKSEVPNEVSVEVPVGVHNGVPNEVSVGVPNEVSVGVPDEDLMGFERLSEWCSDVSLLNVRVNMLAEGPSYINKWGERDFSGWMPSIYYSLARKSVFDFARSACKF